MNDRNIGNDNLSAIVIKWQFSNKENTNSNKDYNDENNNTNKDGDKGGLLLVDYNLGNLAI